MAIEPHRRPARRVRLGPRRLRPGFLRSPDGRVRRQRPGRGAADPDWPQHPGQEAEAGRPAWPP